MCEVKGQASQENSSLELEIQTLRERDNQLTRAVWDIAHMDCKNVPIYDIGSRCVMRAVQALSQVNKLNS